MNLAKLFEVQKVLRDRIAYNEPDRFNKLVLALLVELGECANEWRGFKFWSKDQEPRTKGEWIKSKGIENGKFVDVYENPLLEEYVDGLHFVLELGIEINTLYEFEIAYPKKNVSEATMWFLSLFGSIQDFRESRDYTGYRNILSDYFGLGCVLGFTWEQIEQAYMEKNKVNHQRQEQGY